MLIEYILESLVYPNKKIAAGFESTDLKLHSGTFVTGIVKKETDKELTLINADGQTISVETADIDPAETQPAIWIM